ncbi:MAG: SRPBCC family protein [Propionibacteriaceae bacterium]
MDLTHRFTLATSVDNAWATFNRLERLEPCFPGATITEIDGDDFSGLIRIKMGPIGLVFEGSGRFVRHDERHHRMVIEARGTDKRGYSDGTVKVTATFTGDDHHADVEVHSDLSLTGRPAQLGQGVIEDVSQRLMEQFVSCMSARFAGGLDSLVPGEFVPKVGAGAPAAQVTTVETPPRRVREAERLDLGRVAGPAVLKRLALPAAVVAAVVVVLAIIRRTRA